MILRAAFAAAATLGTLASPALLRAEEPATSVEVEAAALPVITIAKAADALGAPIELRPAAKPAVQTGIAAPPLKYMPLAGRLTSRFGMRAHPILGGYRQHSGVDLAAPTGSPVLATAAGTVTYADWRSGYGLLVVVEHGGGLQTRFAHLSRIVVGTGQRVASGQLVGLVGATGRATGAHLHYEVRRNGRAIDPLTAR